MNGRPLPKRVELTPETIEWLRRNHDKLPYPVQARRCNVCLDTLKRILVRLDLADFPGAKYQVSRRAIVRTWTRPCMLCGNTKPRPVNVYVCDSCKQDGAW